MSIWLCTIAPNTVDLRPFFNYLVSFAKYGPRNEWYRNNRRPVPGVRRVFPRLVNPQAHVHRFAENRQEEEADVVHGAVVVPRPAGISIAIRVIELLVLVVRPGPPSGAAGAVSRRVVHEARRIDGRNRLLHHIPKQARPVHVPRRVLAQPRAVPRVVPPIAHMVQPRRRDPLGPFGPPFAATSAGCWPSTATPRTSPKTQPSSSSSRPNSQPRTRTDRSRSKGTDRRSQPSR